jgi:sugar lactone lactonase YvrE
MGRPAIEPRRWSPSRSPGRRGPWQRNAALAGLELLPIPGSGPEDVAILPDGDLVTGLAEGRICRLSPDGHRYEIVADTGGRPLGIEVRRDGQLVICDASILFSDSSQRFGIEHFKGDLLEHSRTGRLLRWRDGEVEVVADGLAFANGVALTHDGDAAWLAETGAYRISRVWLAGERAGQREVLVDNLPAFPDNLSTGRDGTVWAALPTTRDASLDVLLPRAPALRKLVWALPDTLQPRRRG